MNREIIQCCHRFCAILSGCLVLMAADITALNVLAAAETRATADPFRYTNENFIVVPVYINHKGPFKFGVDSGASLCLVSPEVASKAGIVLGPSHKILMMGGIVDAPIGEVEHLTVKSAEQDHLIVVIFDRMDRLSTMAHTHLDGFLGLNFLTNYQIEMDFKNQALQLQEVEDTESKIQHSDSAIEFHQQGAKGPAEMRFITVATYVNGQGPFRFILDSGAGNCIVSADLVSKLGLRTASGPYFAAGGARPTPTLVVRDSISLRLGSNSVGNILPIVADEGMLDNQQFGIQVDGVIGYNFLSYFKVIIDFPHGILELVRKSDSRHATVQYKNAAHEYSLELPASWILQRNYERMDLLAYDPLRSDGAHFTVTMVFSAEPNLPREDLEKFHQQWIHALKSQTPGLMVNPSESGHMRIDGENALWMNHSMQTGSGMEKYRDFLVLHGDYRYQFMCAAPAALFETSKEDCLEVINGLHFVKKAHPD